MYVTPAILGTLGIVDDVDAPVYRFIGPGGEESRTIVPVSPSQYGLESIYNLPAPPVVPLYLSRRDETFWLAHLPDEELLYVRVNRIRPTTGDETLAAFGSRVLATVDSTDLRHVIVDLRQNNGGNNQLIDAFMEVLRDPRIDQPGRLLVFTDRHTFSAAGNLVATIDAETGATFVGVAPGGSGSQYGDAERVDLPYSRIAAFIPTRHWVFGDPAHQPLLQPMDVTVEPTVADFLEGRDPVLARFTSASPPAGGAVP